ncbi:MAG: hypothetical protein AB7U73_05410 [Pirellulales bacterium]
MKFYWTLLVASLIAVIGCKSQTPMNNPFPMTVPPPEAANTEAPLYSGAAPYYNGAPGQTIVPNSGAPTTPGVPGYTGAETAPTTPPPVSTPTGPTYRPGGTFDFRGSDTTPSSSAAQVATSGATSGAPNGASTTALHTSAIAPNASVHSADESATTEVRTARGTRIRVVEPGSPVATSTAATSASPASSATRASEPPASAAGQEPRHLDTAAASSGAVDIMRLPPIERSAPTVRQASAASAGNRDRG